MASVKVMEAPTKKQIATVEVDILTAHTFQSSECHTDVTAQDLSEQWHISIGTAAETPKRTTQ